MFGSQSNIMFVLINVGAYLPVESGYIIAVICTFGLPATPTFASKVSTVCRLAHVPASAPASAHDPIPVPDATHDAPFSFRDDPINTGVVGCQPLVVADVCTKKSMCVPFSVLASQLKNRHTAIVPVGQIAPNGGITYVPAT
jgi:hypothetical protein